MVDLERSYINLKQIAIDQYALNHECHKVDINELKALYAEIINSPRVQSQISDVASLVKTLEKRGELSPVKIEAFTLIYTALQLSHELLHEHNSLINRRPNNCAELYGDERSLNHSSEPSHDHLNSIPNHETYTKPQGVLSEQVIKTVCSQIGSSWKPLARYLGNIKEVKIEEIEENKAITSNEERARMIFYEYQKNAVPSEMRLKLLNSLELSGRMDIHKQVQNLFFT